MPKTKEKKESIEIKSITFNKIGNFWIDNGIIGLYRILAEMNVPKVKKLYDLEFNFQLYEDGSGLSVSAQSSEMLEKVMNKAKERVIEKYKSKKENSYGWIYIEKENRFEIYEKENWGLAFGDFFAGTKGKTEGGLCVTKKKKDNKKEMTAEQKNIFNEFKNLHSDKKLPDEGYLNSPPKYELGKKFSVADMIEGNKQCNFSGERVKSLESVTGLNYPFLTGISGGLNFQSNLTGKIQIAPKYAFVSSFALFNIFYSSYQDKGSDKKVSCYFLLYDNNLFDLDVFYNNISSIRNDEQKQWRNFKKDIQFTTYLNENLLSFLISIYRYTFKELNRDWRQGNLFSKTIYSFINNNGMFSNVHEFSKIEPLFDFFDKLDDIKDFVSLLIDFKEQIQNKSDNTIFRDKLAERILNFKPLNDIIEDFLAIVCMKRERSHYFISQFTQTYNMEVIKMEKSMVDLCYAIGREIGEACKPKKPNEIGNKSILFTLRNTKNFTEFLKNLERIQSELQETKLTYSRKLFDEMNEQNWEQYKSLISIFAMNNFLYKSKQEGGEGNEQQQN